MPTYVSLRASVAAPADPLADELAAYNRAFAELELPWQWDAATFRELLASADGDCVGAYIERTQRHLLKSYDRGFLRDLVLAKKGSGPRANA
jgi:hypothetical protein